MSVFEGEPAVDEDTAWTWPQRIAFAVGAVLLLVGWLLGLAFGGQPL